MNKIISSKYLIIGSGTAGANAIDAIRKSDKSGDITVITDEKIPFYSRPLITHLLTSDKPEPEKILYRDSNWIRRNNIRLILYDKVISLDADTRTIKTRSGKTFKYTKLLIASGGEPIVPQFLKSADTDGKIRIFTLTNIESAININTTIKKLFSTTDKIKVVVIGAGFIGLKAAEALASFKSPGNKKSIEVSIVELADRILPAMLDKAASSFFEEHLKKHNIKIYLNESAESITPDGKKLLLKSGTSIPQDIIISAIGVKPSLSFINPREIKINRGIIADKYMRTSRANIWVAGDAAEATNFLATPQKQPIPIWPLASKQGTIAGQNMSSPSENLYFSYEGGFPMNSVEVFGLPVISAGITLPLSDSSNKQIYDERYVCLTKTSPEKLQYKKLVFDAATRILVGYILTGGDAIERAGIYTGLIKLAKPIGQDFKDLIEDTFGFISVGEDTWKKKITPLEA